MSRLFFFFALLGLLAITNAHAAPAAPTGYQFQDMTNLAYFKPTVQETCIAYMATLTSQTTAGTSNGYSWSFSPRYFSSVSGQTYYRCLRPSDNNNGPNNVHKVAYCEGAAPSWDGAKYTCATCPTGYTDQGGVCKPPSNCPAAGTKKSSGMYLLGPNPETAIPNVACDANCETSYTGEGVSKRAMVNGVYQYYFGLGSYSYTNQSCTGGATSPASGSVPANSCNSTTQDTGQVNGVTVCIDKTKSDTSNTTKSAPVTNADGSTTVTTTDTTTNAADKTTTTTTTKTTTATDGAVTTTQSTVTAPSTPGDTFCAKNPTDPTCRDPDKDRWNGAGSGKGFSASGDVATAKANIASRVTQIRSEISAKFQPSSGVTGTIPCDSVNVMGKDFSLCMSEHQSTFEMIGSALLAIAFLIAFLMVFS